MMADTQPPKLLIAVAPLLQRAADIDQMLGTALDAIATALGCEGARLYLVDQERRELYSRRPHEAEAPELRLPMGKGIAGTVAASARALASHYANAPVQSQVRTDSWLAVPIFAAPDRSLVEGASGALVIGVLEVIAKKSASRFDDQDQALLTGLAHELTEILAHAQLDDSRISPPRYNRFVGDCAVMMTVYSNIRTASETDRCALIVGASGTGKKLAAQAIHDNSRRMRGPFESLLCNSASASLLEVQLFGVEPSVAAGELRDTHSSDALVARCSEGTLLLEEIGDLPQSLQARIAGLVATGEYLPVGGQIPRKSSVRILASSTRALNTGTLDPALADALGRLVLHLPSLEERGAEDIRQLARHFLRRYSRQYRKVIRDIAPEALRHLQERRWPGNLLELARAVENAVLCTRTRVLELEDFSRSNKAQHILPSGLTLADAEERYILRTLAEYGGNRTRTALALKIGRNTLVRKLKTYKK